MIKFDTLITWPLDTDYPLFRKFLQDYNDLFLNKLFIYQQEAFAGFNFGPFVCGWLKSKLRSEILSGNPIGKYKDWRDRNVNLMLKNSTNEYVWFVEHDFLIKDPPKFFEVINKAFENGSRMISFWQEGVNRFHPACIFCKREDINKTTMFFAAVPPEKDHFGVFSDEMVKNVGCTSLQNLGLKEHEDWTHMNGLWSNYNLAVRGQKPNYYPEELLIYNKASRDANVIQHPKFIELTHKVDTLLSDVKINIETSHIAKFVI